MHAYKSYIFVVSRSEGRATQRLPGTQRLPSRDVLAQAFPSVHPRAINYAPVRSGEGLGSEARILPYLALSYNNYYVLYLFPHSYNYAVIVYSYIYSYTKNVVTDGEETQLLFVIVRMMLPL